MIATGTVRHPTLGLQVAEVTAELARQYGLPPGLFVQAVAAPSSEAGLRAGDVITTIGGQAVRSIDDLNAFELHATPGDWVKVEFSRAGSSHTVSVTVGQAS